MTAFARTARFYDLLYSFKDYAGEAARIAELIRQRNPEAESLLDVACGTGKHLEHLRETFDVAGVDIDEALLAAARERLPGVELSQGDMTSLSLGRRFDAVTCLFSAIGYAETRSRMRAAIAAMAAHLEPGGVLVVEPWLAPDDFEDGHVGTLVVDEADVKIVRMNAAVRDGTVSILDMHYLIGAAGEVVHEREEHRLGLFTVEEHLEAMRDAGLGAEHDPEGLIGRGLFLGIKEA